VLKIEQILHSVFIQYKDLKGSLLMCKMPTKKNNFKLEVHFTLETNVAGFTSFAATSLVAPDLTTHITVVTTSSENPQMPKAWLLNQTCDKVIWSDHFEVLPADLFKQQTNPFTGK